MESRSRILMGVAVMLGVALLLLGAERRPWMFANSTTMAGMVTLEVVLACLWKYDRIFFPATMLCFLAADTGNPFAAESFTLRWVFLGTGALVGFVLWMKTNRHQHFGPFHLVSLFCILAAFASASASGTPAVGALKAASLFLLFLYAATGGRVALAGREKSFVFTLVWACEALVFAVCGMLLVGFNTFGNPNNLGAFIGVIAAPILLWGAVMAESRWQRQRRYLALGLCGILLYVSVCRAAIMADAVVLVLFTMAVRRPRMLLRMVFAGALLLEIMAIASPEHMGEFVNSLSGRFVFKTGHTHSGVFGSRQSPWDDTLAAMKRHPWFGTGFGTSDVGELDPGLQHSSIYTLEGTNREHGSSYLALAEYMGMLGVLPFFLLLVLLLRAAGQIFGWMRRTGSASHYGVPFAMVVVAGLIHAGFEDWLVAPGSYLCVFFWVCGCLLIDLAADATRAHRLVAAHNFMPFPAPRELYQPVRSA